MLYIRRVANYGLQVESIVAHKNLETLHVSDKNTTNYPETAKFSAWYDKAKQNGMLDLKFCSKHVDGSTVESFFTEFNAARNAELVKHPNFF
jgi:uncharacterized protein YdgA (DUF945 family)